MKVNILEEVKKKEFIQSFVEDLIEDEKDIEYIQIAINSLLQLNADHKWSIPRKALIPKDNGKFREVFMFNDEDSSILKAINKLFNEKLGHLLDNKVYSYRKNVSVKTATHILKDYFKEDKVTFIKADISSYFNSVDNHTILQAIDSLVDDYDSFTLLENLYSINKYTDKEGNTQEEYLGIMPGTALSAYLANYILRDIDKIIGNNVKFYSRYSDDLILIDDKTKLTTSLEQLTDLLEQKGLTLNPSKVEFIENAESITYLGLKISKDTVDLSNKNFNKIKNNIKLICKASRKKYELALKKNKDQDKEKLLKDTILKINKHLYGAHLNADLLHKNSKLTYLFKNITTDKTIRNLDFYIVDTLRILYTGKNNGGNRKIEVSYLESLGYISSVQLYNLAKVNPHFLTFKINSLLNPPFIWRRPSAVHLKPISETMETKSISFLDFVLLLNKTGGYLVKLNEDKTPKPAMYDQNQLQIDFINKTIKLDNTLLVSGNEVINSNIGIVVRGLLIIFKSNGLLYTSNPTKENIMSCYKNTFLKDYEVQEKIKHNPYKYFTPINKQDFYLSGGIFDRDYCSTSLFATMFYSFLYTLEETMKEKEYYMIEDSNFPLVFSSSLIPEQI